jgi:hypothetical protein
MTHSLDLHTADTHELEDHRMHPPMTKRIYMKPVTYTGDQLHS